MDFIKGQRRETERKGQYKILWGVLALGILMRLIYVLYTPYTMGQHDTMELGSGSGHFGYIEYFLQGGSLLFDFNPMNAYEFYHPPLFHLTAAAFVRCNLMLGAAYEQAFENLQYLTCFFSAVSLLLFFRIFRELGLKGKGLLAACMLTAFHPSFYLLAGSINNDGLCLMFMAAAVLCTLRWYRDPSLKNILLLSFGIVLGALTKTNALLITPAIAVVMLYVLVKNWKDAVMRGKLLRRFLLFGVITVPLGLSWLLCNYIRFDMPFDFTPAALTTGSTQSVSDYTVFQRLFGLKDGPLEKLSLQIHSEHKDYNIFIALLKTSVLGEYTLMIRGVEFCLLCALMVVNGLLAAVSVPMLLRIVIRPKEQKIEKLFVFLMYAAGMAFYIRFCFEYPKVCSMDFRYIALTAVLGAAAFGWFIQERKGRKSAVLVLAAVIIWSLLSIVSYLGLGFTPRAW